MNPRELLHAEIASLRGVIELRDEEIRQLKALFTPEISFPAEWKLKRCEAAVLAALYAARGWLRKEALHVACSGLEISSDDKIVDVYICKIRSKLKPYGISIETLWGGGYRLLPDDRKKIRDALQATEGEANGVPR